jgi:trehalose 6-phosphate phosphatase
MTRLLSRAEVTDWAQASKYLWLFLDYDGTLADFAPTPFDVEPDVRVIRLLEQLVLQPSIRVTVLSGRSLKHIRQLLPVPGIFLAGSYGVELLTPDGKVIERVDLASIRPVLETIKPKWAKLIQGRKGFFLEDKGWTIALHARFAGEGEADRLITAAKKSAELAPLTEDFRVLGGHKFLEIAPRLASKKETVSYLLQEYPFHNANLLYIGDDDKDEEAFPVIHARKGIALKVLQPSQLSSPTEADFCFGVPADVNEWLQDLAHHR